MTKSPFQFLDPGCLVDDDLGLVVVEQVPADPVKGWVPAYHFEMRRVVDDATMGRLRLRIGDGDGILKYAGNVGYDVKPEFRGRRVAARSVRLVMDLARRHGLTALWIGCRPDNTASRRTCELIGAVYVETIDVPRDQPLFEYGVSITCRYRVAL